MNFRFLQTDDGRETHLYLNLDQARVIAALINLLHKDEKTRFDFHDCCDLAIFAKLQMSLSSDDSNFTIKVKRD